MPTLIIGCIVNDALVHAAPNVQQALLQFNRYYAPATGKLAAVRRVIDRIEASADPVERKRYCLFKMSCQVCNRGAALPR